MTASLTWAHNPVTGELARVIAGPGDGSGERIEVELFLQPGAAVAGAHRHPSLIERFEVLEGQVGFLVGSEQRTMVPGDGVAEVLPGVTHDWWNAGDGLARVRVEVAPGPDAPQGIAGRFLAMIETLWSLGALGRTNAKGMPDPLWLAAIAREYRDVIVFIRPPAAIQSALFTPLAFLARHLGRNPASATLHGPEAPVWIEDPGPNLPTLLTQAVETTKARFGT